MIAAAQVPTTPVVRVSGARRAAALDLSRDPDLIGRIEADFAAVGLVGEQVNCLVRYLAAVSRLLPNPLAVIVLSTPAPATATVTSGSATPRPPASPATSPASAGPAAAEGPDSPVVSVERLAELVAARARLDSDIVAVVDALAAAGIGWPVIADILGVTRQAHHRRHRPDPPPT